jgi:chromosome partitioning protein
MKIITLLNEKGGVAKTTLAVHIAAGLAIRGYRVVLADADAQGNAAVRLGLKKEPGLWRLLVDDAEFEDVMRPVSADVYSASEPDGDLWVIPGNQRTGLVALENPNPFLVRERFEELASWADVVVFDTSPTPSLIHTAIYVATDYILFPTTPQFMALDGLAHSIYHQEQARGLRLQYALGDVKRMGIIPVMFRRNTQAHDVALQDLLRQYRQAVWPCIPLRTIWEKAEYAGETLFKFAPYSAADDEGSEVTKELWALIDRVESGLLEASREQ